MGTRWLVVMLAFVAGCASGDGFVIRDGGGGSRDTGPRADAGADGSLPLPPPSDGGTPPPPPPPPPPPGDGGTPPPPPPPPPPPDGGTFTCTVSGPVAPDPGPSCTTATVDCIVGCPAGDGMCQQRCIESDSTPGMACSGCINSNFIACAQRMGCQTQWDTFVCCAEQHGCLDAADVDTCVATSCAREQDGYSSCDELHSDPCSMEVVATCFP